MTIEIEPEFGVPLAPDVDYLDLRERAEAVCRSILVLEEHGLDVETTQEDREAAAALATAYASEPEKVSKAVNSVRASSITPASLLNVRAYLDEYGRQVVQNSVELRHMVTNRLIEESQNPDPRIRIRALELLGKHSDVGLFTEKREVTVTHESTDALRDRLRSKLQKLVQKSDDDEVYDVAEIPPESAARLDGEVFDLDAEMGLKQAETD